ncbi:lysine biosynthesis protein LysW [Candidatus Omnitrophota bacterium]
MRSREVRCPECEKTFELESDLQEGDTAYCYFCDTELKVIRLNPAKVKAKRIVFDNDEEDEGGYSDYS